MTTGSAKKKTSQKLDNENLLIRSWQTWTLWVGCQCCAVCADHGPARRAASCSLESQVYVLVAVICFSSIVGSPWNSRSTVRAHTSKKSGLCNACCRCCAPNLKRPRIFPRFFHLSACFVLHLSDSPFFPSLVEFVDRPTARHKLRGLFF